MGASREMGRNEIRVRGSAVFAMVQSFHGSASAARVAVDPRPPRRVRVFSLIPLINT